MSTKESDLENLLSIQRVLNGEQITRDEIDSALRYVKRMIAYRTGADKALAEKAAKKT